MTTHTTCTEKGGVLTGTPSSRAYDETHEERASRAHWTHEVDAWLVHP